MKDQNRPVRSVPTEGNVGENVGNLEADFDAGKDVLGYFDTTRAEVSHRYAFDAANHIHTLDGRPLMGTSTVVQVLGKPLTWWAAGMALTPLGWLNKKKSTVVDRMNAAALAIDKIRHMAPREYANYLEDCYRAHNKKKETSAVAGTDMHKALEGYINYLLTYNDGVPVPLSELDEHGVEAFEESGGGTSYRQTGVNMDCPQVLEFAAWSLQNVNQFLWSEGHCYSERLWTGGICDAGAILHEQLGVSIIDFKSSKEAYFDQFIQAGGYSIAIQENGLFRSNGTPISKGVPLIVSTLIVVPFGGDCGPQMRPAPPFEASFEAAVQLHKTKQEFEK